MNNVLKQLYECIRTHQGFRRHNHGLQHNLHTLLRSMYHRLQLHRPDLKPDTLQAIVSTLLSSIVCHRMQSKWPWNKAI